jgi:hypothetical protein
MAGRLSGFNKKKLFLNWRRPDYGIFPPLIGGQNKLFLEGGGISDLARLEEAVFKIVVTP